MHVTIIAIFILYCVTAIMLSIQPMIMAYMITSSQLNTQINKINTVPGNFQRQPGSLSVNCVHMGNMHITPGMDVTMHVNHIVQTLTGCCASIQMQQLLPSRDYVVDHQSQYYAQVRQY